MNEQYVEQRDQGCWITGSRISLESVIFAFLDGLSPETIVTECFPILTLEQVYATADSKRPCPRPLARAAVRHQWGR